MFEIVEKRGQTYINLTRNDSCEISTCPFIDADENKIFIADSDDKPIVLGDDDYVLFCVASPLLGNLAFLQAYRRTDRFACHHNTNYCNSLVLRYSTLFLEAVHILLRHLPHHHIDTLATKIFVKSY